MGTKPIWRVAFAALLLLSMNAYAGIGEGSGNIIGSVENRGAGTYTANATDESTGRSRDITVGADGDFRFAQMPVGRYTVSVSQDGRVVARDTFSVTLNGNTLARFELVDYQCD